MHNVSFLAISAAADVIAARFGFCSFNVVCEIWFVAASMSLLLV